MLWLSQKKRGRREQRALFKEVMTENFRSLGKELDIQVHEAKRTSNYSMQKKAFKTCHIETVKSQWILKAAREKRW